ncbi:hypothetical protein [Desulfogranum japonicum]|nr:hypothetical protein [Desulfogranum japonicum]
MANPDSLPYCQQAAPPLIPLAKLQQKVVQRIEEQKTTHPVDLQQLMAIF